MMSQESRVKDRPMDSTVSLGQETSGRQTSRQEVSRQRTSRQPPADNLTAENLTAENLTADNLTADNLTADCHRHTTFGNSLGRTASIQTNSSRNQEARLL